MTDPGDRAYSNRVGPQFLGFGYIKLNGANKARSLVPMQQNYPNPFSPVTKINFATNKAGNVDLRVFNTRGELAGRSRTSGTRRASTPSPGMARQ